jgi:hypothetical protein
LCPPSLATSLGRQNKHSKRADAGVSNYYLSGFTADLVCLLTALEQCEPETLPPNAIGLTQDLSNLLTVLRSRQRVGEMTLLISE